ncbi:ATP-binding protein [Nocardioides sp. NPDC006273]|uniref:ATP-binding protein n=1 Tax=Nocardioides sp. NPDC006273 TaxID=3155598 RepID=UPI0033B91774
MVERLRRLGLEPTEIEVKAAVGGLPKTVVETLSAFANGDGGTLLMGLDEDGFLPAGGFDAAKIRDALANACHQKVTPPIRSVIEILEFEGAQLVRLDVEEIDPIDKPCFVTERGEYNGSFIRGGDGDRRLSRYEVTQLLSNRNQPTHDQEVVVAAGMDDLDPRLVEQMLRHAAERSPRAFDGVEPMTALKRLGAIQDVDGTARPTLAGLLSLGIYPQQFFPQLFASVIVLPTAQLGDLGPEGERFLENVTIDGPIPLILHEVATALRRNMSRAAIVRGLGREDRYDYPTEVIRELITNALMHRDYSPESRGTQIQIELYPDRLVVKSPGGLFGGVTIDQLGAARIESKSRNATLAKLLADVPLPDRPNETIAENRGSGLVTAVAALRRAGMSPPEFDAEPGRLMVTVPRTALLAPQTIEWITGLGLPDLTDPQHLALAIMRSSGRVSVGMLRAWGVNDTDARRAVRDLMARGVAVRTGGKRYASYRLIEEVDQLPLPGLEDPAGPDDSERTGIEAELDVIVQAIRAGHTTSRGLSEHLTMGYQTVLRRLRELEDRRVVEPTRPKRSSKQSYRIIGE